MLKSRHNRDKSVPWFRYARNMTILLFLLGYGYYIRSTFSSLNPNSPVDGMLPDEVVESSFLPGSLTISKAEALKSCYVNTDIYPIRTAMCVYSKQYQVLFVILPKSGSSTARHMMKYDMNGTEITNYKLCYKLAAQKDITVFAGVRNPTTRFYASYDESFVRQLGFTEKVPEQYREYVKHYEGWNYKQYEKLFYTEEGVKQLTKSFERFVQDYDGKIIFETHLSLQIPLLFNREGEAIQVDVVAETHEFDEFFQKLSVKKGFKMSKVIRGRAYPRRFNVTALKRKTLWKICRLASIDYCCLNHVLPPECLELGIPHGEAVRCRWTDDKKIEPILV